MKYDKENSTISLLPQEKRVIGLATDFAETLPMEDADVLRTRAFRYRDYYLGQLSASEVHDPAYQYQPAEGPSSLEISRNQDLSITQRTLGAAAAQMAETVVQFQSPVPTA